MTIDPNSLPDINTISSVHREQIEAILQRETQAATTDADALAIVDRLIEEAQQGATWDEEGNRTTVHVQDEAAFWDEGQIAAAAAQQGDGAPGATQQKIAIGAIVLLVLVVGWLLLGRGSNDEPDLEPFVVDENGEVLVAANEMGPQLGADLLALSDDLGVRTRIGQPATVELLNPATNASMTLSVINTPVDGRTIPITQEIIDGQLVAQWIAGTVVNYVMGVPVRVMSQMDVGSLVLIRTDTAQTHSFICTERQDRAGQETEVFLQNRPGLTLFPLPAAASPVPVLWCPYDPSREEVAVAGGLTQGIGEYGDVGSSGVRFSVTEMVVNQALDGQLALDVTGTIQATVGTGLVVMGLSTENGRYSPRGDQFQAAETENQWLAQFALPENLAGSLLTLDVRSPAGGSLAVDLGRLPNPRADLQVTLGDLTWDAAAGQVEVPVYITNNSPHTARIMATDFAANQGGINVPIRIADPLTMPALAVGDRQTMFMLRLSPVTADPISLQVLYTVWEVNGLPMPNQ